MTANPIFDAEPVYQHLVNKMDMTAAAFKFVVGYNFTVFSKLAAVPIVKFGDIFVSRFNLHVIASQLKNELLDVVVV